LSPPDLLPVLDAIDPAGDGPDGPLFAPPQLKKLSAIAGAEQQLVAIAADLALAPARRFIAAEALVEGPWTAWRADAQARRSVAAALAEAMAHDRLHNRWGLPDGFVGPFGRRLLSLGADAEHALARFSTDRRRLAIAGSEAATLDEAARFTVGDLAVWLARATHRDGS
jgi:hypothetical protein